MESGLVAESETIRRAKALHDRLYSELIVKAHLTNLVSSLLAMDGLNSLALCWATAGVLVHVHCKH